MMMNMEVVDNGLSFMESKFDEAFELGKKTEIKTTARLLLDYARGLDNQQGE